MVQRIDPNIAAAAMRAAGWEPLVPYPGAGEKWRCRCSECGEIREPRYSQLKQGTGCGVCAGNVPYSNKRATEIMREHGFEPLTPYPGSANTPWPSRCMQRGIRCRRGFTKSTGGDMVAAIAPALRVA